jgi:large subunit ribosomal protein L16
MFEMNGVTPDVAREAMRLAAHKMPIRCKFVERSKVQEELFFTDAEIRAAAVLEDTKE